MSDSTDPAKADSLSARYIQRRLEEVLPKQGDGCIVRGHGAAYQNSRIFCAHCSSYSFPLLAKICVIPNTDTRDPETSRTQYLSLRMAWELTGQHPRYNVPQPVLHVEQDAMIVAEWVEAPSMTRCLYSLAASRSRLYRYIADAAGWLRNFHQARRFPDVTLQCQVLLPRLQEGDSAIRDSKAYQAGLTILHSMTKLVDNIRLECSYIHGDYKTDNLLVAGERIVCIDIQIEHRNSALFDVASFLNHLDLMSLDPRGLRIAMYRRGLIKAFMNSYRMLPPARDQQLALLWIRLFSVLGAWIDLPLDNKSRFRRFYMECCYRVLVRRLCSEINKVLLVDQQ